MILLFFVTLPENLSVHRWGRWQDILAHSQFREGWKESDVEDCARVIVSCHHIL